MPVSYPIEDNTIMKKDLLPTEISVSAYSGYKANERPEFIMLDKRRLRILNIIEKWTEPEKDYFKVLADDGKGYVICWNRYTDNWVLEKTWAPYAEV